MIECQTDSKPRTLADIRLIVNRAGGTITPTAFLFEKKGRILFEEQDKVELEEALEAAIDAGALDITTEEDRLVVETSPADVSAVGQALHERLGLQVETSEVIYVPNEASLVTLSEEQQEEVQKLLDNLEEDPTLQNLYINAVFD